MRPITARGVGPGSNWTWTTNRSAGGGGSGPGTSAAVSLSTSNLRLGRHLLDHDALTCLLILLFIDDAQLNTSRLHRVLRNLCYHAPTRTWVINTLLSILHHLHDSTTASASSSGGVVVGMATTSLYDTSNVVQDLSLKKSSHHHQHHTPTMTTADQPNWLNIYLCAALGSQANVFQLHRGRSGQQPKQSGAPGKVTPGSGMVSIHPQASPVICRRVLDTLISLAKCFPGSFLPQHSTIVVTSVASPSLPTDPHQPGEENKSKTNFWNLLMKLDTAAGGAGKKSPAMSSTASAGIGSTPGSKVSPGGRSETTSTSSDGAGSTAGMGAQNQVEIQSSLHHFLPVN